MPTLKKSPPIKQAAYTAKVHSSQPTLVCYLIDQSGSTAASIAGGNGLSIAQAITNAVNDGIQELIEIPPMQGTRRKNWFEISLIGYGADTSKAGFLLPNRVLDVNAMWDQSIPQDVVEPTTDGSGFTTTKKPVWVRPVSANGTPMCSALSLCYELVEDWCRQNPNSYPPTVFNFTDGDATDGDPVPLMQKLKQTGTSDGNTLLFNVHITASQGATPTLSYPASAEGLVGSARQMFDGSSVLPEPILEKLGKRGLELPPGSVGVVRNGKLSDIYLILDVGSPKG
jgi:hypothetical protein